MFMISVSGMVRATLGFLGCVSTLSVMSCGVVKQAGGSTARVVRKSSAAVTGGISSGVAMLKPGPKIRIVEPREQDMQDFRSGTELAQAHQGSRRGGLFSQLWDFSEKLYFEEPDFSDSGLDAGLLPPPPEP